jgi:regulation of enolase protein 1 (concanavalin A-like superfamily)
MAVKDIAWSDMEWLHEPPSAVVKADALEVTTGNETDFWHKTAYGFVNHNGHFLGAAFPGNGAIEVTFRATYTAKFDQAGLMLYGGPDLWLKAGVELSDGQLFASVVATAGHSDWSVTPVPGRAEGQALTFRASRKNDGVTVRYRIGDETDWQLLRVAYLPPEAELRAGPMCCTPSRAGLVVSFESVRVGPPDAQLHQD